MKIDGAASQAISADWQTGLTGCARFPTETLNLMYGHCTGSTIATGMLGAAGMINTVGLSANDTPGAHHGPG